MIVGAGPVGLLCAFLADLCELSVVIVDKSAGPLQVGRADALNGRTLQLLEVVGLFDALYPLGKPCNTSSVWADGKWVSRQSAWWEALEGSFHKHFLMLGQAYVEQLLDGKLAAAKRCALLRNTTVRDVTTSAAGCVTTLSSGERVTSRFVVGADGSRSFVRSHFGVGFNIERPEIVWAVVDGVIETTFEKVPEIIVFQTDTSDVSWIPREADIDRFYIRMDRKDFTFEEVMERIRLALHPHTISFTDVRWFSQFSVKESVAESYVINGRVCLAGDAAHIHSVNGGQGLNTGLSDAMNLIFKMDDILHRGAPLAHLLHYEAERRPVAQSVIDSSGQLVRSTKYSDSGTHAMDYVKIVEKRAGNITGMGINYHDDQDPDPLRGVRLHDFLLLPPAAAEPVRVYTLLDYRYYTLLVFGDAPLPVAQLPEFVRVLRVAEAAGAEAPDGGDPPHVCRTQPAPYRPGQAILVRPDSYIAASSLGPDCSPITAYLAAFPGPNGAASATA